MSSVTSPRRALGRGAARAASSLSPVDKEGMASPAEEGMVLIPSGLAEQDREGMSLPQVDLGEHGEALANLATHHPWLRYPITLQTFLRCSPCPGGSFSPLPR
jgi:hypothetical protein